MTSSGYFSPSKTLIGNKIRNGQYEFIKLLGEGGFGDVYQILDVHKNERYAIKLLKCFVNCEEDFQNTYLPEINLLKKTDNEFIIKYIDSFIEFNRICLVTVYYKDGDLDLLIKEKKAQNENLDIYHVVEWSKQIVKGLEYLHDKKIVHRDIKPKNIFRNGGSVVIGDLGLALTLECAEKSCTFAGTLCYLSPEFVDQKLICFKTDVWSFGCVLYELIELKRAFEQPSIVRTMNAISLDPIPLTSNNKINDILEKCWNRNKLERSTSTDLIAYLKKLKFKDEDYIKEKILIQILVTLDGQFVCNELIKKLMNIEENDLQKLILNLNAKNYVKAAKEDQMDGVSLNPMKKTLILDNYGLHNKTYLNDLITKLNSLIKKNDEIDNIDDGGCFKMYLRHLNFIKDTLDLNSITGSIQEYTDLLEKLANYYKSSLFDYKTELDIQLKVLGLKEKYSFSLNSLAKTLNDLGIAESNMGEFKKSIEYHNKALTMPRSSGEDLIKAETLNGLGITYLGLNKYEKSITHFKKALSLKKKILSSEHPSIGCTLNSLGVVYSNKGDFKKAIELYNEAFKIYKAKLAEDHRYFANLFNNLGYAHFCMGDNDKALLYSKQSFEIFQKSKIADHPSTSDVLNNLGIIYSKLGESQKSIDYFKQSINLKLKISKRDDLSIAPIYNNLGVVYKKINDFQMSVEYFEKSLVINEKHLTKKQDSMPTLYINLINLYGKLNDDDKVQYYSNKLKNIKNSFSLSKKFDF